MDGEAFEISELKWDGEALSFAARMPSTDTLTRNCFRMRADGRADLQVTIYEIWKKQEVKVGERPKGWDGVAGRTTPSTRRAKKARA